MSSYYAQAGSFTGDNDYPYPPTDQHGDPRYYQVDAYGRVVTYLDEQQSYLTGLSRTERRGMAQEKIDNVDAVLNPNNTAAPKERKDSDKKKKRHGSSHKKHRSSHEKP